MWNRYVTQNGRHLILSIGQLIVLLVCVTYLSHIYLSSILPDRQASNYFQQADCFIVSKRLAKKGHIVPRYRADFLINYSAGNAQYNRWVSGNGMDLAFTRDKKEQEAILSQYAVGQTYKCRYSPADPEISVLVLRHNWLTLYPLMIPAAISMIAFYYLIKNLFQLIVYLKNKRSEKIANSLSS